MEPDGEAQEERRRALSNVGGDARMEGDADVASALARAATPPEDADPRALTHGLHTWPARMHPWTARALIEVFAPEGTAVVDPFMGGGTVMVEAMVAGHMGFGGDLNPVAALVAWARTRIWDGARRAEMLATAGDVVAAAKGLRDESPAPLELKKAEGAWYDPPALHDLWSLREAIAALEDPDLRRMLIVILSSVVVKASRQVSDTVVRQDPDHGWVPRGRVSTWFERRAEEHERGLAALAQACPAQVPEASVQLRDAREPGGAGDVGCVITSPPYPGVYDYAAYQERRYALLGFDPEAAYRGEIGSRRVQRERGWQSSTWRFEDGLSEALRVWAQVLRPGGKIVLVLGDGQHARGVIRSLPVVQRAAERAGLRALASVSQARRIWGGERAVGRPDALQKEEHLVALEVPRE